jgi:hypothetical protein
LLKIQAELWSPAEHFGLDASSRAAVYVPKKRMKDESRRMNETSELGFHNSTFREFFSVI